MNFEHLILWYIWGPKLNYANATTTTTILFFLKDVFFFLLFFEHAIKIGHNKSRLRHRTQNYIYHTEKSFFFDISFLTKYISINVLKIALFTSLNYKKYFVSENKKKKNWVFFSLHQQKNPIFRKIQVPFKYGCKMCLVGANTWKFSWK